MLNLDRERSRGIHHTEDHVPCFVEPVSTTEADDIESLRKPTREIDIVDIGLAQQSVDRVMQMLGVSE